MTCLLTVLTPTLNCHSTISDTFRSVERVASHLPGHVQHIIGDAGSTDGTFELTRAYCSRNYWATLHMLTGLNIPQSLNSLLKFAHGTFVMVLNGDDFFHVDGVVRLLLKQRTVPAIVCGHVTVVSSDGRCVGYRGCRPEMLDYFMSVNHPAMLVHRSLFRTVGVFDESSATAYDYVWTWKAFRLGAPFIVLDEVIAYARLGGISTQHATQAALEVAAAKFAQGQLWLSLRGLVLYWIKVAIRRFTPQSTSRAFTARYRRWMKSIDHY